MTKLITASLFSSAVTNVHEHVMYLNSSKFFAGIVMITLNICSRYATLPFSKGTEAYIRANITGQLLIFAIAWMGTRDIYTSIYLTAAFTVLSAFLLNDESTLCIIPQKYKKLAEAADKDGDGVVTNAEIQAALNVLNKSRKAKQRDNFLHFFEYSDNA